MISVVTLLAFFSIQFRPHSSIDFIQAIKSHFKIKRTSWSRGCEWKDLPRTRDDDAVSWSDVERECGLSKPELSRLKNARCPGG
jgi:hypothetical protein